jgi:hypothetical protein
MTVYAPGSVVRDREVQAIALSGGLALRFARVKGYRPTAAGSRYGRRRARDLRRASYAGGAA